MNWLRFLKPVQSVTPTTVVPEKSELFFARDDLISELASLIRNTKNTPSLLLHSEYGLYKPNMFGSLEAQLDNCFKLVYQDVRGKTESIQSWLADLQKCITEKLNVPLYGTMVNNETWSATWLEFETWLNGLTENYGHKLIVVLDRYEQLHTILQTDPEQGARLLAAIRSFSQHQHNIHIWFAGPFFLTELSGPDWGQYFVHVQNYKIDYLQKSDALRLITGSDGLVCPPELQDQLFGLTQGHPALLQWLCSELANKTLTQAVLDAVTEKAINDSLLGPIQNFWIVFCSDVACKNTVREIIARQQPSDKKHLHRLREHGFITRDTDNLWRLRVPLFERWIKQHDGPPV